MPGRTRPVGMSRTYLPLNRDEPGIEFHELLRLLLRRTNCLPTVSTAIALPGTGLAPHSPDPCG